MRWIDRPRGVARSPRDPGRSVALGCCLVALLAASCGTAREQGTSDRNAPSASATAPLTTAALDAGSPDASAEDPPDAGADAQAPSTPPAKKRKGELAHFYTALDGLDSRIRREHVRVLWIGDSHGQADFWSGRLRSILQKRFGNGGPGFLHLGYRGSRHDGVDLGTKDKWHAIPKNPATSQPGPDALLGLGGVLTGSKTLFAQASAEIVDPSLPAKLRWDLCHRFHTASEFLSVTLAGGTPVTLTPDKAATFGDHPPLLHASFTTEVPVVVATPRNKGPKMVVSPTAGHPSLCGVVVEADPAESPGVVLDNLGINGARYTTFLAWDEEAWLAEYLRRSPSLVIFEYGTNESGDVGVKVETYADKVGRAVARIRKKKPDVDCVVLAPTDRADQEERSAKVRDALREAARANVCLFWDTIEAMGGKGSMRAWRDENPPRGAKDGIHLTVRGYQELGDKLGHDLLSKM